MGSALLIDALTERNLRTVLQERGESLPNQVEKPAQRVTMRRMCQMLEGIDLLRIVPPAGVREQGLNLMPMHQRVLRLLGPEVETCPWNTS